MENTQRKTPTWLDLKNFINTLTEEQLTNPLIWWGDESGGKVESLHQLEEDYINDGEAYSPRSSFDSESLDEAMESNEGILTKGTPMIFVD